ncbi:MAG: hypothetical protein JWS10_3493 [Cypionkella sp.]|uniref:hypothetical protein n=1 Tax=Cypionkella sp. TaxID=2811411 RepID=UPI0026102E4B|nr:hypothetical protein [Cypionkella sp.]MDB5660878.1 hypothetical protein [Cypionkella sp.]
MADEAIAILNDWLRNRVILQPFSDDETIDGEIDKFLVDVWHSHSMKRETFEQHGIDLNSEFEAYYRQILNGGMHDGP